MEMEGLGAERKRQMVGRQAKEAPLSRQIGSSFANLTEGEQRRPLTATHETKFRKDDKEKNYGNAKEGEILFSIDSARRSAVTKVELKAVCAKHCRVLDDGRYQLDLTKIKCLLSPDELNDLLLVRNLIHRMIVSAQVYPLIFGTSSEEDNEMVQLRSLPYFNQLLADAENGVSSYQSLSDEQKWIESKGYSIHGCVHSWTIHALNQEWDYDLARLAVKFVGAHVPGEKDIQPWLMQRRLLQHVARCSHMISTSLVIDDELTGECHTLGRGRADVPAGAARLREGDRSR
jgi:hypothetical protein